MKFSDYARRRKEGFSHHAAMILSDRTKADSIIVFVAVLAILFSIASALAETVQEVKQEAIKEALRSHKEEQAKLESVIVNCLSHHAVMVDGKPFECRMERL